MKKLLLLCSLLIFTCSSGDSSGYISDPNNSSVTKIMPLGASRVEGERPNYESYRYYLWKKLKENNFLKNVSDRPGHDKRYALNSTFFKKTINYKMKFNLSLGLKNTIEWYIKNRKWLKSTKKSYKFKRLGLLWLKRQLFFVVVLVLECPH